MSSISQKVWRGGLCTTFLLIWYTPPTCSPICWHIHRFDVDNKQRLSLILGEHLYRLLLKQTWGLQSYANGPRPSSEVERREEGSNRHRPSVSCLPNEIQVTFQAVRNYMASFRSAVCVMNCNQLTNGVDLLPENFVGRLVEWVVSHCDVFRFTASERVWGPVRASEGQLGTPSECAGDESGFQTIPRAKR